MPQLIGLCGPRGAGKDTAYSFIKEWCDGRGVLSARRALADPLKWSFARIFIPDCTLAEGVAWCDQIKQEGGEVTADVPYYEGHEHMQYRRVVEITGREALQRYGTEAHRQVFHDQFWIDALLPVGAWEWNFTSKWGEDPPDFCVVTDVRFDNEAHRVQECGGQIWRIHGRGVEDDDHASEGGIDPHYIALGITNDGGFRDFREKIFDAMETQWTSTDS